MDKSNWIASITSISGCLNGSLGPITCGAHSEKYLMESKKDKMMDTFMADVIGVGYRALSCGQNLIEGTQNKEPEYVVKVFKQKSDNLPKSILKDKTKMTTKENQDIMYELNNQN